MKTISEVSFQSIQKKRKLANFRYFVFFQPGREAVLSSPKDFPKCSTDGWCLVVALTCSILSSNAVYN